MPRNRKARKNRTKKNNSPVPPSSTAETKKKVSAMRYVWGGLLSVSAAITAILTFPEAFEKLQGWSESPKEKFTNEKYVQGIIIPYDIQQKYPTFLFKNGNQSYHLELDKLREGQVITPHLIKCVHEGAAETTLPIILKLIGDRLYVSSTFYDVDRKYLGELNNERWTIFKDHIADYSSGTRYLEIIDHYNNVVFSVTYESENSIQTRGYFRGNICSTVCSTPEETGLHMWQGNYPDYKDSILMYASKIKRIGPSKFSNRGLN